MEPRHDTVLLQESVDALVIAPGDIVVDATLGGAGHFKLILSKLGAKNTLMGIDADTQAIERAQKVVTEAGSPADVRLVEGNFKDLGAILDAQNIKEIDKILFDLGWSGFQLALGRGFSFRVDEPLSMTYGDPEASTNAKDLVNHLSEESLADLIFTLGEERFARGIARSIVEAREEKEIETTFELVAAIEAGTPSWYHHRRLHPATKTFQALRIAVNDELGALREGLAVALARLAPGGRIAVISFHSIEDRIVKSTLRDAAHECGTLVTRKPIVPSSAETAQNPRARSAKLRVYERSMSCAVLAASSNNLMSTYA
ncbi:MAG: Ribosomal small subunit methyltransferase [Parcubacteria group bacterium]|nr:Ribosomal small subunit methyltransferase [Parcubacteria group bacterium]